MVGCGSSEGLGVEVVFLYYALMGEWLWAKMLGIVVAKDCVIACRLWFESWNMWLGIPNEVLHKYIHLNVYYTSSF